MPMPMSMVTIMVVSWSTMMAMPGAIVVVPGAVVVPMPMPMPWPMVCKWGRGSSMHVETGSPTVMNGWSVEDNMQGVWPLHHLMVLLRRWGIFGRGWSLVHLGLEIELRVGFV